MSAEPRTALIRGDRERLRQCACSRREQRSTQGYLGRGAVATKGRERPCQRAVEAVLARQCSPFGSRDTLDGDVPPGETARDPRSRRLERRYTGGAPGPRRELARCTSRVPIRAEPDMPQPSARLANTASSPSSQTGRPKARYLTLCGRRRRCQGRANSPRGTSGGFESQVLRALGSNERARPSIFGEGRTPGALDGEPSPLDLYPITDGRARMIRKTKVVARRRSDHQDMTVIGPSIDLKSDPRGRRGDPSAHFLRRGVGALARLHEGGGCEARPRGSLRLGRDRPGRPRPRSAVVAASARCCHRAHSCSRRARDVACCPSCISRSAAT